MVFAISGKFENMTHSQVEKEIKKLGGKTAPTIGTTTTHLLVSDVTVDNAQTQKAKEQKLKIVSVDILKTKA
jgi:NAD-dependent DNA ligase